MKAAAPSLMLDAFASDDPQDYLAGVPTRQGGTRRRTVRGEGAGETEPPRNRTGAVLDKPWSVKMSERDRALLLLGKPYTGRALLFGHRPGQFGIERLLARTGDIGLGEDGPTHQPVEHVASLRLIPGLDVWRPADTAETLVAWRVAIESRSRPELVLESKAAS